MKRRLPGFLVGLVLATALGVGAVTNRFDVVDIITGLRFNGAATSGQYVRCDGTNCNAASLNVGDAGAGTLALARGGTNQTSWTAARCVRVNAGGTGLESASADCSFLPVADTTSVVEGSADGTKEARFEVDGFTTATTRVFTLLDANMTLAGSASALTSGRIPFVTTGGLLADEADFGWEPTNNRFSIANATTADDNATNMFRLLGTMPTTPSAQVSGLVANITGAGSASQITNAMLVDYLAGYTGGSATRSLGFINRNAGTGTNLHLGTTTLPEGNHGVGGAAVKTGGDAAGHSFGGWFSGQDSTGVNVGAYGNAADSAAGTNIAVLGSAANSTEPTGLKNLAGFFTLNTSLPTENVSAALGADNGSGTDDMARFYDNGTASVRIQDGGKITSAGTGDLGWSVQSAANQACNTTCTSACAFGFDAGTPTIVDCADATADKCVCAGAS